LRKSGQIEQSRSKYSKSGQITTKTVNWICAIYPELRNLSEMAHWTGFFQKEENSSLCGFVLIGMIAQFFSVINTNYVSYRQELISEILKNPKF